MKMAFVGKGGSGKTTLAALTARRLAGSPLLAIDADINQHLATALGASEEEAALLPALGDHQDLIKGYLRGSNPRIGSTAVMVKTTPPGRGSMLIKVHEDNPIYQTLVREVGGVRLAVTGPFATEDLGVACYHSKVGTVELLLNHLVDGEGEYVIVDMTAGADSFASGLFTRFDATFLVCEPTLRSVGVYRQYAGYAREFGVRVHVVGNKIEDESDVDFLREHVGGDLLTWIGRSPFVKAAERGVLKQFDELEPQNAVALDIIAKTVDGCVKDWPNTPARRTSSTCATHMPGQTPRPAKTWPPRSTPNSCSETPGRERMTSMSLEVPTALLERAEAGDVDDAEFVECVRRSLPYAYRVISEAVSTGQHSTPPPSEKERGQLLRALASDAIRAALERHFGRKLAFQNCHKIRAFTFSDVGGEAYQEFISPVAQLRNQSPELRDC